MNEIIGVIGAGTMGNGIAQTAAKAGFNVVMCDVNQDFVDRGYQNIEKSLDRFIKKEQMTEEEKGTVRSSSRQQPRTLTSKSRSSKSSMISAAPMPYFPRTLPRSPSQR